MLINQNGFREYDARWLYKKDIDLEGIENLGKGLGTQIVNHTKKTNPRIIVGHDYRSYSEEIKAALKKGLISTGCHVVSMAACRMHTLQLLGGSPQGNAAFRISACEQYSIL